MRSARVANHFLRAPVALTALSPHHIADNLRRYAPLIDVLQLLLACSRGVHAVNHYLGEGGERLFFSCILFQFFFFVKIFVIKTASTKSVYYCLNKFDYFIPKKYPAVFKDVRKYATKRDYFSIFFYRDFFQLYYPILSRNLADDNFYVRALFATR